MTRVLTLAAALVALAACGDDVKWCEFDFSDGGCLLETTCGAKCTAIPVSDAQFDARSQTCPPVGGCR